MILSRVARRLRRDPLFWIGGGLLLVIVLMALLAGPLSPHPPDRRVDEDRLAPSATHLLGTDANGFDVWSRLVHGARASLLTGVVAVALALLVGVPLGASAGYAGGIADGLVMRGMDVLLAFPSVLLAIAVAAAAGGGSATSIVLAVAVVQVPAFARQVRASVLQA